MSAIHDLISQVTDPRLRDRLAAEWAKASKDKQKMIKIKPTRKEVLENKRSRSAILRTIKKL